MENPFRCKIFVGFLAQTANFKYTHNISMGLKTGLCLRHSKILYFFILTCLLVDLLTSFVSVSQWRIKFWFNLLNSKFTQYLQVAPALKLLPEATPNHSISTTMLHSWYSPKMLISICTIHVYCCVDIPNFVSKEC